MSLTVPQIKRLNVLARAGLSDAAIAVVISLDWETDVSADSVRYYRINHGPGSRPSFGKSTGIKGMSCPRNGANFGGGR